MGHVDLLNIRVDHLLSWVPDHTSTHLFITSIGLALLCPMTLLMTQETETINFGLLLRHPRTYLTFTPYFRFESLGLSCLVMNLNLWLTSRPIIIPRCRMTSMYQVTPTIMRRYINVSCISYVFAAQPLLFFLGQDII